MSETAERWRKPVKPLAVKDAYEWATGELGRATLDFSARFSSDDKERVRLGYVCIQCWEPHESPFPDACALCGFPMKAEQSAAFEQKFRGVERDPRAATIERELGALDDRHERRFHQTKTGIVVPTLKGP